MTVRIKVTNPQAVDSLIRVAEILAGAIDDMPWRDDLPEARRLLVEASRSLTAGNAEDVDDEPTC